VFLPFKIRPIVFLAASIPLTLSLATTAPAQQRPVTLTLEEAIEIARRSNPEFLTQRNNEVQADWAVKEAYGALLPSASVGGQMNYQAAGVERFGASLAQQTGTGYLSSSYSAGLSYRLAGETFMLPRQERANRNSTIAQIEVADFTLTANVTRQYLAVRRAGDAVLLARQELERAAQNKRLVDARVAVGAAIALDAKQAEVESGRAEVELLRAENLEHTEKLRLVELLGIEFDPDITLTSEFPVFEPAWSEDELAEIAISDHPQLRALRATRNANSVAVRMAKTQYLPSLNFSIGISGYAQRATNPDAVVGMTQDQLAGRYASCHHTKMILEGLTTPVPHDCSAYQSELTAQEIARIRDDNSGLPFNFTRQPVGANLQISLPIFNGFSRERRLATARVAEENAHHQLRREELRLKTEVATTHQSLVTAQRAVTLERRNMELATDQLTLARERYSVGSVAFFELKEAETVKARADRAYLVAVYTFHESLAALESAVGRKLDYQNEGRP
jgi:outer membrane protein